MKTRSAMAVLLVAALAGGVWYERQHAEPGPARAATETGHGKPAQMTTSVVTAAATRGDFPVKLHSIGYVEPIATVAVKSRVQSQLLQQNFRQGAMVKQGDLLFTLDDREFVAQVAKDEAAIARDQAALTRTQGDLTRARQLLAKNAGTQQALDQAVADEKTAQANLQADQAALDTDKLHLSYTKIYAPIAGRAGAVTITPGNLVNANDTGPGLVTITELAPVRVTFTLPEVAIPQVQKAMSGSRPPEVRVFPHGAKEAVATGHVTFLDSTVDQSSGTITLKAEFGNKDLKLWPGEYCDVEVDLGDHPDAVSVPTVALQPGQNGSFVFVVTNNSVAQIRNVTTGLTDGTRTEITSGLEPGDKVVVDGQLRLANGAPVREAEASTPVPAGARS